ncbi:MAG: MauE/DoxX family redox-associated membrane protein [Bacteroidota bacterium]
MKPILIKSAFFIISAIMGVVFIFSGYVKLLPAVEPFEFTFVDLGLGGWRMAPFIARFMIGLEFLIGLLLITGLYMRFTIKLTVGSLIAFCIYLVFIMIKSGNNGNCGCFGAAITMTPLEALIKNAVMLAVCFLLYKYYEGFTFGKIGKWLFGALFITAFAMPHILNYVDLNHSQSYLTKKDDHFKLELDSLYDNAKIRPAPKTLSTGKHIISFMSMSCPHCRIAAKKMKLIKEKNPGISMFLVLNGEYDMLPVFFDDTKARNIDYCVLNGRNFIRLAGLDLPVIYLVNNSVVEVEVNYMELDQAEIETWLAKP